MHDGEIKNLRIEGCQIFEEKDRANDKKRPGRRIGKKGEVMQQPEGFVQANRRKTTPNPFRKQHEPNRRQIQRQAAAKHRQPNSAAR